jgi:hypothetical protein
LRLGLQGRRPPRGLDEDSTDRGHDARVDLAGGPPHRTVDHHEATTEIRVHAVADVQVRQLGAECEDAALVEHPRQHLGPNLLGISPVLRTGLLRLRDEDRHQTIELLTGIEVGAGLDRLDRRDRLVVVRHLERSLADAAEILLNRLVRTPLGHQLITLGDVLDRVVSILDEHDATDDHKSDGEGAEDDREELDVELLLGGHLTGDLVESGSEIGWSEIKRSARPRPEAEDR